MSFCAFYFLVGFLMFAFAKPTYQCKRVHHLCHWDAFCMRVLWFCENSCWLLYCSSCLRTSKVLLGGVDKTTICFLLCILFVLFLCSFCYISFSLVYTLFQGKHAFVCGFASSTFFQAKVLGMTLSNPLEGRMEKKFLRQHLEKKCKKESNRHSRKESTKWLMEDETSINWWISWKNTKNWIH